MAGLLNAVGDVAAMAANAKRILADAGSLAIFREGALRTAARFDLAVVLPQYEALYGEVVERMRSHGIHQ